MRKHSDNRCRHHVRQLLQDLQYSGKSHNVYLHPLNSRAKQNITQQQRTTRRTKKYALAGTQNSLNLEIFRHLSYQPSNFTIDNEANLLQDCTVLYIPRRWFLVHYLNLKTWTVGQGALRRLSLSIIQSGEPMEGRICSELEQPRMEAARHWFDVESFFFHAHTGSFNCVQIRVNEIGYILQIICPFWIRSLWSLPRSKDLPRS
jgi:hypothetical protein